MTETLAFLPPNEKILSRRAIIVSDLRDLLGAEGIVDDAAELVPFETDGFIAVRNLPLAVALPRTTAEVAALLKYCARYEIPVVPRGAGTSLSGGAIPQNDAVVIALTRMNRILDVDFANRAAVVQAVSPISPFPKPSRPMAFSMRPIPAHSWPAPLAAISA